MIFFTYMTITGGKKDVSSSCIKMKKKDKKLSWTKTVYKHIYFFIINCAYLTQKKWRKKRILWYLIRHTIHSIQLNSYPFWKNWILQVWYTPVHFSLQTCKWNLINLRICNMSKFIKECPLTVVVAVADMSYVVIRSAYSFTIIHWWWNKSSLPVVKATITH